MDFPQLTGDNSNDDQCQTSSTTSTFLQQIRDLANSHDDVENDRTHTSPKASPFQRTVNWTFENMKMLIGSDLPIFGDEQHPAVSLRLRYLIRLIHIVKCECFSFQ